MNKLIKVYLNSLIIRNFSLNALPENETTKNSLSLFSISSERKDILGENNIQNLFPIQSLCYQPIINGKNLIAQAPTGQGKTLAFLLPLFELIEKTNSRSRKPKAIILSPTRELVQQTYTECRKYGVNINSVPIYGGVSYIPQENKLRRGVDIVVGTPGRVFDLVNKGVCDLSEIKYIILDEADRMLEMGFKEQLNEILNTCPKQGSQYMLFSATIPPWVDNIVNEYMSEKPTHINLINKERACTDVKHCYYVLKNDISKSLIMNIHNSICGVNGKSLIFCDRKKHCDVIGEKLGKIAGILHGDVSQYQRSQTLEAFKNNKIKILIATDVASRGLDIENVDLVLNLNLPKYSTHKVDIESYIHRSGRTGRAGKKGTCISLINSHNMSDIYFMQKVIHNQFSEFNMDNKVSLNGNYLLDIINQTEPSKTLSPILNQLVEKYGLEESLLRALNALNKEDELGSFSDEISLSAESNNDEYESHHHRTSRNYRDNREYRDNRDNREYRSQRGHSRSFINRYNNNKY